MISWQRAEELAVSHMHAIGFPDARRTGPGADGGIDVHAADGVAQVKHTFAPAGRPEVQRLRGASHRQQHAVFYSISGYTSNAVEFADEAAVALFHLDETGSAAPVNRVARTLLRDGPSRTPDVDHLRAAIEAAALRVRSLDREAGFRSAREAPSDLDPPAAFVDALDRLSHALLRHRTREVVEQAEQTVLDAGGDTETLLRALETYEVVEKQLVGFLDADPVDVPAWVKRQLEAQRLHPEAFLPPRRAQSSVARDALRHRLTTAARQILETRPDMEHGSVGPREYLKQRARLEEALRVSTFHDPIDVLRQAVREAEAIITEQRAALTEQQKSRLNQNVNRAQKTAARAPEQSIPDPGLAHVGVGSADLQPLAATSSPARRLPAHRAWSVPPEYTESGPQSAPGQRPNALTRALSKITSGVRGGVREVPVEELIVRVGDIISVSGRHRTDRGVVTEWRGGTAPQPIPRVRFRYVSGDREILAEVAATQIVTLRGAPLRVLAR